MTMETPFSVLTNLAYIACGIVVMRGRAWYDPGAAVPGIGWYHVRSISSWLVGSAFIVMGAASAWYHFAAGGTANDPSVWLAPAAQLADERGMYLLLSVLAGVIWGGPVCEYSMAMDRPLVFRMSRYSAHIGLVLGLFLAAFAAHPFVDSMVWIPALVALCLSGVALGQSWGRALKFLVGFLGIAMIRQIPESGIWNADPLFSYDLLHGAWHAVTALLLFYLYKSTEG